MKDCSRQVDLSGGVLVTLIDEVSPTLNASGTFWMRKEESFAYLASTLPRAGEFIYPVAEAHSTFADTGASLFMLSACTSGL